VVDSILSVRKHQTHHLAYQNETSAKL